eukprot:9881065-Heterocapsa_arctica.AAC.1
MPSGRIRMHEVTILRAFSLPGAMFVGVGSPHNTCHVFVSYPSPPQHTHKILFHCMFLQVRAPGFIRAILACMLLT